MSGTLTWLATSKAVNSFSGTKGDYSVTLEKKEKDIDGKTTEQKVANAEFYLYRITQADPEEREQIGIGSYRTDANGLIEVSGLVAGSYYFLETSVPYGYDYDKEEDGTDKKRYDFEISTETVGAGVNVDVEVFNIRKYSEVEVDKEIENYDESEVTEEQKELTFTFAITFSDGKEYPYIIKQALLASEETEGESGEETEGESGEGSEGESGEETEPEEFALVDGKFTLKHGESAVFRGVPIGIQYNIVEITTEEDEFWVASNNHTGTVKREDNQALFTNIFGMDTDGSLTISKTVTGTSEATDLNAVFTFTVNLGEDPEIIYPYDLFDESGKIGSGEIKSGNTIELKHGQKVVFTELETGLEYKVKEADVAGFIPQTIEQSGEIIVSGVSADFVNTKEPVEEEKYGNLIVTKTVEVAPDVVLPGEDDEESQGEGSQGGNSGESQSGNSGESESGNSEGSESGNSEETEGESGEGSQGEGSEGSQGGSSESSEGESSQGDSSQGGSSEEEGSQGGSSESEGGSSQSESGESSQSEAKEDPMEKIFNFTIRVGDEIYTTQLKHGESHRIDNIPVGTDYEVIEEDYYADGYITSGTNTNATIVEGDNHAEVKNMLTNIPDEELYGRIRLEKLVVGGDNDKEFTFHVKIGNGETREIKLTNGGIYESEEFLVGTHYQIYEENYYVDGYITTSVNAMGNIIQGDKIVAYTNTYQEAPPAYGQLEISKVVSGKEADEEKTFTFTVTFSDGENYPYVFTNQEGNTTAHATDNGRFTLKHGEKATFNDIPAGIVYEVVEETATDYIQGLIRQTGIIVQEALIKAEYNNYHQPPQNEVGLLIIRKVTTGEGADLDKKFDFIVTVDSGAEPYEFSLKNGEERHLAEPVGTTYEVREKDYTSEGYLLESIQRGSGTVTAHEEIEIIATNEYVGPVLINRQGSKTWQAPSEVTLPEEIIVYLKNGNLVVAQASASEATNWEYTFEDVPKYDEDGEEIDYTVEEEAVAGFISKATGLNLTNTYVAPIAVSLPEVEKRINVVGEGEYQAGTFAFILTGVDMPMPEGSSGNAKSIQFNGEGSASFGEITYALPGTYTYTIEEVVGSATGYTYDTTKYTYTVIVEEKEGELVASATINIGAATAEKIVFTNIYTPPVKDETSLTVRKVWTEIPRDKQRPASVEVQLYKNGKAEGEPVRLSDANEWAHTWNNLETNVNWSVDELEVPEGYSRVISVNGENGYTITNTYREPTPTPVEPTVTPEPGTPTPTPTPGPGTPTITPGTPIPTQPPGTPDPKVSQKPSATPRAGITHTPRVGGTGGTPVNFGKVATPKTDDPMSRNLWFAVLILSVIGLRIVFVRSEKENKKRRNKEKMGKK